MDADHEVYIETSEDVLSDFEVGYVPEQFDGFETAYPACVKLVTKET